jgi:hypothetical protein
MRRYLLVVLGAAVLSLVTPALASSPNIPSLFARQIAAIERDASAPAILLPSSMPIGSVGPHAPAHLRLYPQGRPSGASYILQLGALPNCGGTDSCSIASFAASKGEKILPGFTTVTVPGASQAQYHGLLCGGSCSPPQIEYDVNGVLYFIQANLTVSSAKDESTLIAAAEASIKAGPR